MNGCLIFSHSRHTRSHDDRKKWLRLLLKYGHNEGLMHTGNGCWGEIAARDELDYVFGEGARRVVILIFLTFLRDTVARSLARLTFLDSGESGGSSAVAPMSRCWDASSLSLAARMPAKRTHPMHIEIVCACVFAASAGVSVRAHVFLLIQTQMQTSDPLAFFPQPPRKFDRRRETTKSSVMRWSKINQYYEA